MCYQVYKITSQSRRGFELELMMLSHPNTRVGASLCMTPADADEQQSNTLYVLSPSARLSIQCFTSCINLAVTDTFMNSLAGCQHEPS